MAQPTWSYREDEWYARAAIVLAAVIGLIGAVGASGPAAPAEVVAVTIVVAAAFEARARWPRLPSVVVAVWTFTPVIVLNVGDRSEATLFLLVVAVSVIAFTEPDRRIRLVLGGLAVLSPALIAAVGPDRLGWPFWMMGIAFGWLGAEQMRRFRSLVAELQSTRDRLAAQAVQIERRRIAADLHDLVGHSLTVVLLTLTGARRRLQDDPAGAAVALREAEEIGRASLAEIRRNVAALRLEGGATPIPSAADLPDLVGRMVAAGSDVRLEIDGDPDAVEAIKGLVVYRVVQESLNNAARHAPGASASVTVTVGDGAVEVSVVDTGGGGGGGWAVAGGGGGGVGLIGMRERVEAVGGTLSAGPVAGEGGGWAVRARLPRLVLAEGRVARDTP